MWWVGKRQAIAYVGDADVRLALGEDIILSQVTRDRDEALDLLTARIAELPRGVSVRVALSSALARPFLLPKVEGAVTADDWRQIAATQIESGTGLSEEAAVWMDESAAKPKVAVAMEVEVLKRLTALGSRIASIQPGWSWVLEALERSDDRLGGLAVSDGDGLTLLLADGDSYLTTRFYPGNGQPARSVLSRALITHDQADGSVTWVVMEDVHPNQPIDHGLPFWKRATV